MKRYRSTSTGSNGYSSSTKRTPYKRSRTTYYNNNRNVNYQVQKALARKADYKITTFSEPAPLGVSATGLLMQPLWNLTRGDAGNQFEGMKIMPKSLKVRFQLTAAEGDLYNSLRVIIFQWSRNTTPGYTDILDGAYANTIRAPLGPRNWSNKSSYKILTDRLYNLEERAFGAGGEGALLTDVLYVPKNKLKPVWFGTSNAGTQPERNGLYILFVTDSIAITHPALLAISELVYTDN